mgnify:CR=1 FL=1
MVSRRRRDRSATTGSLRLFVHDAAGALAASTSGNVRTTDAIATTMPVEFARTLEVDPTYTPFKRNASMRSSIWNRVRTQRRSRATLRASFRERRPAWPATGASRRRAVKPRSIRRRTAITAGWAARRRCRRVQVTLPSRVYPLLTTDADGVVPRTTAISDTPGVTPLIQGDNLLLDVAPGTERDRDDHPAGLRPRGRRAN